MRIMPEEIFLLAFINLYLYYQFSDVTLVCDYGQSQKVHKIILLASSTLFRDIVKETECNLPCLVLSYKGIHETFLFVKSFELFVLLMDARLLKVVLTKKLFKNLRSDYVLLLVLSLREADKSTHISIFGAIEFQSLVGKKKTIYKT